MKLKGSKISSKFSLQRAKLPNQNKGKEALLFNDEPKPQLEHSKEDKTYSKYLEINPILAELVGEFNLVYISTKERPKRTLNWENTAPVEPQKITLTDEVIEKPKPKFKRAKKETISEFTARILEGYNSYSREEIIEKIITDTEVDQDRAFKGFIKMRKDRIIFRTPYRTYYLSSSTPF